MTNLLSTAALLASLAATTAFGPLSAPSAADSPDGLQFKADTLIHAAAEHPDMGTSYLATLTAARQGQMSGPERMQLACALLAEADARYFRYKELIAVQSEFAAGGRMLPESLVRELQSLRRPPLAPAHRLGGRALAASCAQLSGGATA